MPSAMLLDVSPIWRVEACVAKSTTSSPRSRSPRASDRLLPLLGQRVRDRVHVLAHQSAEVGRSWRGSTDVRDQERTPARGADRVMHLLRARDGDVEEVGRVRG